MPIYEYRCLACGEKHEHLQKISAQPIAQCPACQSPNYSKQVTAAGFQLKGSGWYATDFRGGSKPAAADKAAPVSESSAGDSKTTSTTESKPSPAASDTGSKQ